MSKREFFKTIDEEPGLLSGVYQNACVQFQYTKTPFLRQTYLVGKIYYIRCSLVTVEMMFATHHTSPVRQMYIEMQTIKNTTKDKIKLDRYAHLLTCKTLLDSSSDLIWSVDQTFKVIDSNPAFEKKISALSTEAGNNPFVDWCKKFYQRCLAGDAFTEIYDFDPPATGCFETSFFPIRHDVLVVGVACFSRDVTIVRKHEHQLKLLESVVVNALDSILITESNPIEGDEPKIVYINEALARMTGYRREEIVGKTSQFLHGPKTDLTQIAHAKNCMSLSQPCEIEVVNYKKNGEEFWMHTLTAPVKNSEGSSTHFISIGRDVTERLGNLAAIKEQNIKLRNIAWVQSHDVRGPLARIMGLINLLTNHDHSTKDMELLALLNGSLLEMDLVIKNIVQQTEEIDGLGYPKDSTSSGASASRTE